MEATSGGPQRNLNGWSRWSPVEPPPGLESASTRGEVRLEVDGRRRERELPGRLGRVLLGYLALNRHRAVYARRADRGAVAAGRRRRTPA